MREMKDSGVEWIGEIPKDWSIQKIKHVASLNGRIGWQGLTSAEYCDEGAYLITGINFENGKINWETCVHVPMSRWYEAPQIQISNSDLLITKDGTVGKVAIVHDMPDKTSLNSGVLLIKTTSICQSKFLFWVLQSDVFWKWFRTINAGNSTIIHLYQYDLYNFSFPLPRTINQSELTYYLDTKCAQIDAIIARQQEVIEKLNTYKLSVITEAVTKGLNPDVPMKDSGVEWIGKIPEHWTTTVFSNGLSYIQTGPFGSQLHSEDYIDNGIFLINPLNIKNGNVVPDPKCCISIEKAHELPQHMLSVGDIIFARRGEMGRCACLMDQENQYFCGTGCMKLKCNSKLLPLFAVNYLQTRLIKQYLELHSVGTTMANLNSNIIASIPLLYPPIGEQQKIITYIKQKCTLIDDILFHKELTINKLTEYKKSLIYEVVTGKKEV